MVLEGIKRGWLRNFWESNPEGRRKMGRAELRWLEDAKNGLREKKEKI
jgi:hypothetical protein